MKLSQELIDKIKEVACKKLRERVEVDFCINNICGKDTHFYSFFNPDKKFRYKSKNEKKSGGICILSMGDIHFSYILYEYEVAHIDMLFALKNAIIEELSNETC